MKDSANCLEVCELVSESDCVISFYIGFNMDMKVKLHGNTVTEKTVTIHTPSSLGIRNLYHALGVKMS